VKENPSETTTAAVTRRLRLAVWPGLDEAPSVSVWLFAEWDGVAYMAD
jgi:hypothetical protein